MLPMGRIDAGMGLSRVAIHDIETTVFAEQSKGMAFLAPRLQKAMLEAVGLFSFGIGEEHFLKFRF